MGKTGGSSWLSVVKRAFRSPTKDPLNHDKNASCRRRDHDQHEEEEEDQEEKKRGKRIRWIFKKQSFYGQQQQETVISCEAPRVSATTTTNNNVVVVTKPTKTKTCQDYCASDNNNNNNNNGDQQLATTREHFSALAIQTAFRGYLARRALKALKGLVKIQALVRGYNVRKRAKMTLQCMQALVRVQTRVLDQRLLTHRLSFDQPKTAHDNHPNALLRRLSSHPHHLVGYNRNSLSREENSVGDRDDSVIWEDHAQTLEHIEALLLKTKQAAFKREKALSHAFSNQMWTSTDQGEQVESETEAELLWSSRRSKQVNNNKCNWDQITTRRSFSSPSCDHQIIDPIKTVEIDTYQNRPSSMSHHSNNRSSPSSLHSNYHYHQMRPNSWNLHSPAHEQSPQIPKPILHNFHQSVTPRCFNHNNSDTNTPITPNYMAATASAVARSQSAPRHRANSAASGNRDRGSARKRLSFVAVNPEPAQHRRDSIGSYSRCSDSEGSPSTRNSSHDQLRRWLR